MYQLFQTWQSGSFKSIEYKGDSTEARFRPKILATRRSPKQNVDTTKTDGLYLPKPKEGLSIVYHFGYTLGYNEAHEQAAWVAYLLTADRVKGKVPRKDDFRGDAAVVTGSATLEDYKRSGYDRGHLAPAADMKWHTKAMSESFLLSNVSPQPHSFNEGCWNNLEVRVRKWALQYDSIYIVTGPVLNPELSAIGPNKVSVPRSYYKCLISLDKGEEKGMGYLIPTDAKNPYTTYAVSIDQIEAQTGLDFFWGLDDSVERVVERSLSFSK